MLERSDHSHGARAGSSGHGPRPERIFARATGLQTLDRYGAASQLTAITAVLGESRLKTVVELGDHGGWFSLSLLDAGLADKASVYDVNSRALAAARTMARQMGLADRIEFVERAPDLDTLRALPEADMMICANVLHHAGMQFDQATVRRDGWEHYARAWLTEMRRKSRLAIVGIAFEEAKPRWDVPHAHKPARFGQCLERAGWAIRYDANARDIEKIGVERANGRYTKGGILLGPSQKQNAIKQILARLGGVAGNGRQNYHLYILEAGKVTLPHLVIVAGVSGSGKSTFVDQLQGHGLPDEIYRRLPAGVGDWPVVGSSMRPVFPHGAPGIVLQYDMNGRGLSKGRDFTDDPLLDGLENASVVTVVNLRPPPHLMIDQLVVREGGGRTKEQILDSASAWRLPQGSRAINRILRRWKPWIDQNRLFSCRRKINLYSQKGWLEGMYARWDAYLRALGAKGPAVEQIFLEPDPAERVGSVYAWRVARDQRNDDAEPARDAKGPPMQGGVERVS